MAKYTKTEIISNDGEISASVLPLRNDPECGLLVQTEKWHKFDTSILPFINTTYGIDMNQNGAFSGTPEVVHDGLDSVAWTGTNVVGMKATFNSTDQANSGSQSVKVDNPNLNDIWQFELQDSTILNLDGYVAFTFAIYIDKDWAVGDSITVIGWDTALGISIGNSFKIEDYVNEFQFDVWQQVVIPFPDIAGINLINAIRFENVAKGAGKSPKIYLDDLQFEEQGVEIVFHAAPVKGTVFHLKKVRYHLADNISSAVTNGTMDGLSYDAFMGVSELPNGIVVKRLLNDATIFASTLSKMSDFALAGANVVNSWSDGTNTFITMEALFDDPLILYPDDNNELTITINDDLSSMLLLTATLIGSIEI